MIFFAQYVLSQDQLIWTAECKTTFFFVKDCRIEKATRPFETLTCPGPRHSFTPLCANFLDSCLCLRSKLTIFGGETRFSYFRGCNFGPSVGDVETTPVNSVPWSRCFDESKGFRFFVLIFSQMMTCFISDSGENFREQTGHRSSRMFGGGISMKISLSCWCSSGCWCCSGW